MKLSDRIRNFFLSMTRSKKSDLSINTSQQRLISLQRKREQYDAEIHEAYGQLKAACYSLYQHTSPEHISTEELVNLYHTADLGDYFDGVWMDLAHQVYQRYGHLESVKGGADFIKWKLYANVLVKLGFLPEEIAAREPNLDVSQTVPPVGTIIVHGNEGEICSKKDYYLESDFLEAAEAHWRMEEPISVTVYTDPITGTHIDTSRLQKMSDSLVSFSVRPYQKEENQNIPSVSHEEKQVATVVQAPAPVQITDPSAPVGRIDYYGFSGKIGESIEYSNEADFIAAIKQDNYCGVPIGIVVYSDPVTGKHMDTSWRLELDPPPLDFSVKSCPAQPGPEQSEPDAVPDYEYEP